MLALSMVVKDCASTLRQILSCVSPYVDEIVIVLGGESSDDTEAVAREFTDKVFPFDWCDDFSAARNFSLSHVTEPYWMWLDGDDISVTTVHAIRGVVDFMEERRVSCVWLPYIYETDRFGNPSQVQMRERIFRRSDGWRWRNRVHEVVSSDKPSLPMLMHEAITIVHGDKAEDNDTSAIERNAHLLRLSVAEDPRAMRNVLALAHAEYALGHMGEAKDLYGAYYYKPESKIEQWWAACQIARICLTEGDYSAAKGWGLAALQVDARYKDAYCLMAHACWGQDQGADETLAWAISSIAKEEAPLAICRFPREYTLNLWEVVHRAYAAKRDYTKAYETVKKASEMEPVAHWDRFVRLYQEAMRMDESEKAALTLADHLTRRGDALRAKWLLENYVPANVRNLEKIVEARDELTMATAHAFDTERYAKFYGDETELHDNVAKEVDRYRWDWVAARLEKAGAKSVLDVGCGRGEPALDLGRRGYEVTGIDIHGRNVKIAQEKADADNLPCQFEQADLEQFYRDFTKNGHDNEFDAVILAEVLEHLPPHLVGHYLRRADALGKRVIFTTPFPLSGDWPGLGETGTTILVPGGPREHLTEFRRDELEHFLVEEGRQPVELYAISEPWNPESEISNRSWVGEYERGRAEGPPVIIYVGSSYEEWTPHSIDERGLGGSETATVRIANEFRCRGHRVVVYAEVDGVYDGVLYRHYSKFHPSMNPWLLVLSRHPVALGEELRAHQTWLWCHDIHYMEQDHLARADKILLLSEWHKQDWMRRYGDTGNLAVTSNAISEITGPLRDPVPHRFIYASSGDRGLDLLLDWWPDIRKQWDDAELHIFYGFDTMLAMADRAPHLRSTMMKIEALVHQPGIVWRGRVGQKELYDEFANAQFWLYPSISPNGDDWYETYCITALEAQANGCIPLTRPVGALPERMALPERCLLDTRDIKKLLKQARWWDSLPKKSRDDLRWKMADYARGHTWDKVVDQWIEMTQAPTPA